MATTVNRVLGEALKLAPDDRARRVAELLASLEPDAPSGRRTEAERVSSNRLLRERLGAGSTNASWIDQGRGVRVAWAAPWAAAGR